MTDTTEFNSELRKQAAIKGVLLGAILGVLGILSFYALTGGSTSFIVVIGVPFVVSFIIPLALAIAFSFDLRNTIGGYWNFKQAVTGIFVMFLLAFVTSYMLRDLLFAKVIEPDMIGKTQTAMVNSVTTMLEKSGASQADIDNKLEDMQQQLEAQKNASVGKQIQSVAISIIFVFVLSVIFAAMFKRERPVYMTDDGEIRDVQ